MGEALPELGVLFGNLFGLFLLCVQLRNELLLTLQDVADLHLCDSEHLYESLFGPFTVLNQPVPK